MRMGLELARRLLAPRISAPPCLFSFFVRPLSLSLASPGFFSPSIFAVFRCSRSVIRSRLGLAARRWSWLGEGEAYLQRGGDFVRVGSVVVAERVCHDARFRPCLGVGVVRCWVSGAGGREGGGCLASTNSRFVFLSPSAAVVRARQAWSPFPHSSFRRTCECAERETHSQASKHGVARRLC